MENMIAIKEGMMYEKMGWSTILDLQNRLIVYVSYMSINYKVDYSQCDPDGLPLVLIEQQRVTRVRKMTEEEFEKYVKEFGMKMEIEMKVVHVPEKDVPKQEKGGNVIEK